MPDCEHEPDRAEGEGRRTAEATLQRHDGGEVTGSARMPPRRLDDANGVASDRGGQELPGGVRDEVRACEPGEAVVDSLRGQQPAPPHRHERDGADHDRDREREPPRVGVHEHVHGRAQVDLPHEVGDREAGEDERPQNARAAAHAGEGYGLRRTTDRASGGHYTRPPVAWEHGQQIVRREVWRGRPWMCTVVVVVDDAPDLLATYLPEGAPFSFPPSADGRPHPWLGKERWQGHGVLTLQRPAESYAVWHFWDGPRAQVCRLVHQPAAAVSSHSDRLRHAGPGARRLDPGRRPRGPSRTRTSWKSGGLTGASQRQRWSRFARSARRSRRCSTEASVVGRELGRVRARSVVARALLSRRLGRRRPRPAARMTRAPTTVRNRVAEPDAQAGEQQPVSD